MRGLLAIIHYHCHGTQTVKLFKNLSGASTGGSSAKGSVCVGAASQQHLLFLSSFSLPWAPGVSMPPPSLYCNRLIHLASVQSACYPFWIEYSSLPAAWSFRLPLWAVSSWPQERWSRPVPAVASPALMLSCLQRPYYGLWPGHATA